MYFIGYSKWFILSGRLVAGVGLGALACCFSEVVKNTETNNRARILSFVMMGRQFGLIIGPSINFFVYKLDFYIGPFRFYNLSAPGVSLISAFLVKN
jgi:ceroid-lipofuscinosis MFS transporter 7